MHLLVLVAFGLSTTVTQVAVPQRCSEVVRAYGQNSQIPTDLISQRRLAACLMEEGKLQAAAGIAQAWTDPADQPRKLLLQVLVSAEDGDMAQLKERLNAWSSHPRVGLDALCTEPLVASLARESWYAGFVLHKYMETGADRRKWPEVVKKLTRLSGKKLLPLKVAAADLERPVGEIAVWKGVIRDARIERSTGTMALLLEGYEKNTEHVMRDRHVKSSELKLGFIEPPKVETTYKVQDRYEEAFVTNGRYFMVRYQKIDEAILEMGAVAVAGVFDGVAQSPLGSRPVPALTAFFVEMRREKKWTRTRTEKTE